MRTHDLPGDRPYITPPVSGSISSVNDSMSSGSDKTRSSLSSVSTTTSIGSTGSSLHDHETLMAKRRYV